MRQTQKKKQKTAKQKECISRADVGTKKKNNCLFRGSNLGKKFFRWVASRSVTHLITDSLTH